VFYTWSRVPKNTVQCFLDGFDGAAFIQCQVGQASRAAYDCPRPRRDGASVEDLDDVAVG